MRIELVITNDAGESSVIASSITLQGNPVSIRTMDLGATPSLRAMTTAESYAASELCVRAAFTLLPLDPSNEHVAAAFAGFIASGGNDWLHGQNTHSAQCDAHGNAILSKRPAAPLHPSIVEP